MVSQRHLRNIAITTTAIAVAAIMLAGFAIHDSIKARTIAANEIERGHYILDLVAAYHDTVAQTFVALHELNHLQQRRLDVLVTVIMKRNPELGPEFTQALASAFYTAGESYGVSPRLLASMCEIESALDPAARSSADAIGICQVMPLWLPSIEFAHSPADLYYWWFNIQAAAMILKHYQTVCGGGWKQAVSCYHGGPGSLSAPKESTVRYLGKVTRRWASIRRM